MSGKPAAKKAAQDGQLSETREAMKSTNLLVLLLEDDTLVYT